MTRHLKGKSIRIFLADGTPQGILIAEIMNWTGHVISAPRTKLMELIQRTEMSRTGIYFLTGPNPESTSTMVYIGESDNVGKRLAQHNKDGTKDFWEKACIITSKDQNLTKAHVRYLESRLISIVQSGSQAKIINGTAPEYGFLPEADIADMEYFISQVRLIMPVLGLEFLREKTIINKPMSGLNPTIDSDNKQTDTSPIFVLTSRKYNLTAEAQEIEGDFIVLPGSNAIRQWIGSEQHNYFPLYQSLLENGKLGKTSDQLNLIFQEDVLFNSPSAAAAIVLGRAANGRTEWKVKGTKKTYADWQNEQIKQIEDRVS